MVGSKIYGVLGLVSEFLILPPSLPPHTEDSYILPRRQLPSVVSHKLCAQNKYVDKPKEKTMMDRKISIHNKNVHSIAPKVVLFLEALIWCEIGNWPEISRMLRCRFCGGKGCGCG